MNNDNKHYYSLGELHQLARSVTCSEFLQMVKGIYVNPAEVEILIPSKLEK